MAADAREPVALTIAGSDPSGGAGIQADLKTFTALGVYGASVITALTAQNTRGVQGVAPVEPAFVGQQLDSVLGDLRVVAAKTGMLATAATAWVVAKRLALVPDVTLVVDPVMVATSGDRLLAEDAIAAYCAELLPRAALLTPNLPEAALLLGDIEAQTVEDCIRQAMALTALGCRAVLVKGGHAASEDVVDVLCDQGEIILFPHRRVATRNSHGTGCTLSAAITALMALGMPLRPAIEGAIEFLSGALVAGAALTFGAGPGPVDHLFRLRPGRS